MREEGTLRPRTVAALAVGEAVVGTGVSELGTTVLRTEKTGSWVGQLSTTLGLCRRNTHISITFGLCEAEHAGENMTPVREESET